MTAGGGTSLRPSKMRKGMRIMNGHIRKRETQQGVSWQVILDRGEDNNGKRLRNYYTFSTKKEAQAALNGKIAEYNKGAYIEPSRMTVKECAEEWMKVQVCPRLAANTIHGYAVNLERHTIPYIGNIPVQKLTATMIQEMYQKLEEKGLSPRSIRYVHTTLHEALNYAYRMQIISKNPAEFVSVPKQQKYEAQVYDKKEVGQLLEAAKGTSLDMPIRLAVGLGLRRGELLALQWEDVDFEENTVYVHRNLTCINNQYLFGEPKTKSGIRKLSAPPSLMEALKHHKVRQMENKLAFGKDYQDNHLICCRPDGKPIHTATFSQEFNRFLKSHGLKHIRLHDLRHTNATLMLQMGVPAKVASERLGHANISITLDTYTHVVKELNQEAAEKLEDIFAPLKEAK